MKPELTVVKIDEPLLKEAVRHLAFDAYFYRSYSTLLRDGSLLRCPPVLMQAVLYALLLHLRLLLDFFFKQPTKDDIWVGHFRFFPEFDAAFLSDSTDPPANERSVLTENLNKRLAHFTATRWTETTKPMEFYAKYFPAIDKLLVTFETALPAELRQIFSARMSEFARTTPARI